MKSRWCRYRNVGHSAQRAAQSAISGSSDSVFRPLMTDSTMGVGETRENIFARQPWIPFKQGVEVIASSQHVKNVDDRPADRASPRGPGNSESV